MLGFSIVALFVIVVPSEAAMVIRFAVAGIVLLALPVSYAIERFTSVQRRDPMHMAAVFAVLIFVATAIPAHWLAMVIVFVAVAMTLISNGAATSVGLVVSFGWIGFLGASVLGEIRGGVAAMLVTGLVFVLARIYYQEWLQRRAAVDERYERLVSAARLFFWEIEVETETVTALHGDVEGALGWSPEAVIGTSFRTYLADPHLANFTALEDELVVYDRVLRMHHRDGSIVPIRSQIHNLGNGFLQAVASDVTELTEAAERIRHQSEHDELTGLLNRRGLLARVDHALQPGKPNVCLLVIDLVRFQDINEAFGHDRGDEVLQIVGNRLAQEADSEVVARLGGNEFAVMLACGSSDASMAAAVARVGELVRRPVAAGGAGIAIRASLGIAPAAPGVSAIELLRQGDMAVHEAKLSSRPWCKYEPTPTAPIVERLTLAAELDRAIERGEFSLWVQPKVSMVDGTLAGIEALCRWHHPRLGVLSPERFIGLVEISEAYHRFSEAMVAQALEIASDCTDVWPDVEIAVNLHPRSFDQPHLVERIKGMLMTAGLTPKHLKLEITEVDEVSESGTALMTCLTLHELGIGLSVDDFGTGHASLNRLRLVHPTEVKLDQAFVRNLPNNAGDRTIVRSTVELANELGIACVAEGVETAEVCEIVASLGCTVVQGYLFGRPMPRHEFMAQLRNEVARSWEQPVIPALGVGTNR